MRLRRDAIIGAFAAIWASTASATAAEAPVPSGRSCEIRVWQSKDFANEAPSNYAAFGLIGALAQGSHDSRYPAGSTERQMEIELRQEVIGPLISALPWQRPIGAEAVRVSFVEASITRDEIKALRSAKARNSDSAEPCYVEFYVDRQTFLGGMVQSNLMSEFTIRHFDGDTLRASNGKIFKKVKGFPAKDEAGVAAASASFRAAFADNLGDFLEKKFAVAGRAAR